MKQTVQLGTLSAVNIGIAFLFQWYALTQLGPGIETDALFAAMTLPQLVLTIISGSLMHVLVPLLAGEEEDRLQHDAWAFLFLIGGLIGLLACILYVTAQWWIPLTVPGFDEAGKALTVELSRIQMIGLVFTAINSVQWAAYHARQQFVFGELAPTLSGVLSFFILVWALPQYGVIAAAWINVIRSGLQTILLMPAMGSPILPDLRRPAVSTAWRRIKPILFGSAYYKTDPLVDRFLLSLASSGSLSLYYLSQQIYGAINQIINKAISAPLVPLLSNSYKNNDASGFRKACYRTVVQVCAVGFVGILSIILFGNDVLNLIVGHGSVNAENILQLHWILICLSGMFFGGAVGQIFSSSFYATGDTKTVVKISTITYSVYLPSKLIAYYAFGITGLAVVTSMLYIVDCFVMAYVMVKKEIWNHPHSTLQQE